MIIPTLRRIVKDDLAKQGQLPPWIDGLLSPLNEFMDRLTLALRQNLDFANNFSGQMVTQKLTHGVTQNITTSAKLQVIGVIPLYFSDLSMDSFGWVRKQNGVIGVTITYKNGTAATAANVTMQILYKQG